MNWIEAVVLGVVQGLTEFLPVSSSGHLVLFQHLFELVEPELLFNISVHVGTLLAVLIVFYRDILQMLEALVRLPALVRATGGWGPVVTVHPEIRLMAMIVAGSIPTALLGVVFAQAAEQLFGTLWLVGVALLVTGAFLWLTQRQKTIGRPIDRMQFKDALIIGFIQGMAIIPGISRSGATISAALYLGVDRELAGRFSFLLSIPAILGAWVLGLDSQAFHTDLPMGIIVLGSLAAAIVGYLALVVLLKMVKKGQLHRFAPYCWLVGLAAVLLSFV